LRNFYDFFAVVIRGTINTNWKARSLMSTASGRGMIKLLHGLFPIAAVALAAGATLIGTEGVAPIPFGVALFYGIAGLVLIGTVFAAVHHAETIAHVVGEPFGTLVVTIAVTVIEVSLIASIMLSGEGNAALARDTVFSVIMIVCNGLVGLCLLLGGLRYREQAFSEQGASAYLSVLVVLAGITLVLPNYTTTVPGPVFSDAQLAFVSVITIALYLIFLFIQAVHHRDYFVHQAAGHVNAAAPHVSPWGAVMVGGAWLVLALAGVILLAKKLAAVVAGGLASAGAPPAAAGVFLATLVLLPEVGIAVRAARQNDLQRSINAALGSTLATIGLTIPAVAMVTLGQGHELVLGLDAEHTLLLVLTFAISFLSFGTGRTNILMGFVHLVMFAVFLFLTLLP
jgi:Ca2+:H+ antiporter